jgi:predicted secreted hydrolase
VPLHDATPVATATPAPIRLPADDAPHHDLTEWWYYTGHLAAADGRAYGFELVMFQIERQDVPVVYAAHFAVTDHQRAEFHDDQRTWNRSQPPTAFDLGDGTWQIAGQGSSDLLKATMNGYAIDLQVTPTKPPALHGNDGVISFGPVGDSYYYSDTRLSVKGTVVDHGTGVPVTGEAWKDRQWGNFLAVQGGGWDWYSFQLSTGEDLMLFVLRGANGAVTPSYGTLVGPDGRTVSLAPDAAKIVAQGQWTSPHSGATYPSGWSVSLPGQELALTATPVLADQELDTTQSTGTIYWEGEVTLTGTSHGKPLAGKGYVELTGYAK